MRGFKSDAEDSGQGRISRGVQVTGDVLFAEALHVEGRIIGKLASETGSLLIEQGGDVQADIDVGICVIRGTVRGNVNCKSRAEIYKTGRVEGDISSPVLLVEEGALLSGAITMSTQGASKAAGTAPANQDAARLLDRPERDRLEHARDDAAERLHKSKVAS
jgi:cytoskeletal protein CcmA (bactofilin family)